MIIDSFLPEMSAFELAQLLSKELRLGIPISCGTEEGSYFQFDPNNGVVHCSSDSVEDIAVSECGGERTHAPFVSVLSLALPCFDAASCEVDESIKYATFACLHEFGHYLQSIEWDTDALEARAEERDRLISEAKVQAEEQVNNAGIQLSVALTLFESKCRSIPIERDADIRAKRLLGEILGVGDLDAV